MKRKVFRYPLSIADEQVVDMPAGAHILTVARREGNARAMVGVGSHESVEMWALVDPEAPLRPRRIRMAGTGQPLSDTDSLVFLASVQIAQGQLVFHVFEAPEDPPLSRGGERRQGGD